jgi:5-formyltetrahydrofolate cyclo-ligase
MSSTPAAGPALHEAKRELRAAVLAARDALPPRLRAAASEAITARVLALPEYAAASTVLLTLPFRSEWDTRPVVEAALAAGKRVVLPRVDTALRVLTLHRVEDLARDVAAGYCGIPEPRVTTPVVAPDGVSFALVPGVAFDTRGRRLGYGGGYYDRLLPLLPAGVPRVGCAYDVQIVAAVPAALHDATVDVVVTPTRTLAMPRHARA